MVKEKKATKSHSKKRGVMSALGITRMSAHVDQMIHKQKVRNRAKRIKKISPSFGLRDHLRMAPDIYDNPDNLGAC